MTPRTHGVAWLIAALSSACGPAPAPPAASPVPSPAPDALARPGASLTAAPASAPRGGPDERRGTVSGRVELAPALQGTLARNAQVVVAAYAVDGPRIPLAVRRFDAAQLPVNFLLDDSAAVNPAFALSKAVQVVVVAQIASPASAAARRVDLEGRSVAVPAGTHGLLVRIDRRQR